MKNPLSFYKKIFHLASIGMVVCDDSGQCIEANEAMGRIIGGAREDVLSQNYYHMKSWEDTGLLKAILYAKETNKNQQLEVSFVTSLGRRVNLDFNILPFVEEQQNYLLVVIYDITTQKQAEEELKRYRNQLEQLVVDKTRDLRQKTIHLEETNTALKVLLKKREEDKKEIEKDIYHNIEKLIFPYLEKLKEEASESRGNMYLEIIESNLKEITALFSPGLSDQILKLTPAEIQIANMIKQGKTTKEISGLLNLSMRTINFHRENIRNKLGIKNQKVNLRTHLMARI